MARKARNNKTRKTGQRRYRKRYDLICEGSVTELEYFSWLKNYVNTKIIHLEIVGKKRGQNSPQDLIKVAKQQAEAIKYKKGDEMWIIMDVDQWTNEQFQMVSEWERSHERNHVAVTNPKFEYWLLLHDLKNPGTLNSKECNQKYLKFMGSKKHIDATKLTLDSVYFASKLAKQKYKNDQNNLNQTCYEFIPSTCGSTLFNLINSLEDSLSDDFT